MTNRPDFAAQSEKAKSSAISKIVRIARKEGWTYEDWRYVSRRVREALELHPEGKKSRRIPRLLTEDELRQYLDAVQRGGNLLHEVMIRLMLLTGVRVSELVSIRIQDVDLQSCKVFLGKTKGDKPREVLFPESFRPVLQAFIQGMKPRKFLFETGRYGQFTTRRVQQIVRDYGERAGLKVKIHPHLFRHMALTRMSASMSDAAVQVLSGHSSRKSLEIYQHLAVGDVARQYQEAMGEQG